MNGLPIHLARLTLPKPLRAVMYNFYLNRRIERLPSRRFLEETIVPALADAGCGKVLFVGVGRYNRRCFKKFEELGISLWTIDIDPGVARWGAKHRHVVGDVCTIDRLMPARTFDAAIVNGVFGYGLDDPSREEMALEALARVIRGQGILVIGAQSVRYRELESIRQNFVASPLGRLPPQIEFPPDAIQVGYHIYDLYRRKPDE